MSNDTNNNSIEWKMQQQGPDERVYVIATGFDLSSIRFICQIDRNDWTPEQQRALAAKIIKAVNSHDNLMAALEKMMENCSCHCGGIGPDGLCEQPCDYCDEARTALNAAK